MAVVAREERVGSNRRYRNPRFRVRNRRYLALRRRRNHRRQGVSGCTSCCRTVRCSLDQALRLHQPQDCQQLRQARRLVVSSALEIAPAHGRRRQRAGGRITPVCSQVEAHPHLQQPPLSSHLTSFSLKIQSPS